MTAEQTKRCVEETAHYAVCVASLLAESLPDSQQIGEHYTAIIDRIEGRLFESISRAEVKAYMLAVARKSVELLEAFE